MTSAALALCVTLGACAALMLIEAIIGPVALAIWTALAFIFGSIVGRRLREIGREAEQ